MNKEFLFDIVLEEKDICNLIKDREFISKIVEDGGRIVVCGRRNTGKTSLVKSVVMKGFKKKHRNSAIVFVDFMGVKNLAQISDRLKIAYEKVLSEIMPTKAFLSKVGDILKAVRPNFSYDPISTSYSFSLGIDDPKKENLIESILVQLGEYHKEHKSFIIFDEFQDISFVDEAEALMRNYLQNLPGDLPVVILGSKKHLLSKIFTKENAPFSNWGRYHEISKISAQEYMPYLNERFNERNKEISLEVTEYLVERLQSIPECINIVSDRVARWDVVEKMNISKKDINRAIIEVINERSGLYEEKLSRLTEKEERFLVALAHSGPVKQLHSKNFLSIIKMSTGGSGPLVRRMENSAIIYKTVDGYIVGDPLLEMYLKHFRSF